MSGHSVFQDFSNSRDIITGTSIVCTNTAMHLNVEFESSDSKVALTVITHDSDVSLLSLVELVLLPVDVGHAL